MLNYFLKVGLEIYLIILSSYFVCYCDHILDRHHTPCLRNSWVSLSCYFFRNVLKDCLLREFYSIL